MPVTERYRGLAERAGQMIVTAGRLVETGALRSAAKVLADASLLLLQAADERDVALGIEPANPVRDALAASVAQIKGAAE